MYTREPNFCNKYTIKSHLFEDKFNLDIKVQSNFSNLYKDSKHFWNQKVKI